MPMLSRSGTKCSTACKAANPNGDVGSNPTIGI